MVGTVVIVQVFLAGSYQYNTVFVVIGEFLLVRCSTYRRVFISTV